MVAACRVMTAIIVCALGASASGCGLFDDQATIMEARGASDSATVMVIVATCHADLTVEVEEGPDEIVVTVHARNNETEHFCADGIEIELAEALGNRSIVDGSNGRAIDIGPPWG